MLLAGGVLNAVLVPQIVRAARPPDGGQDFVNRLLTLPRRVCSRSPSCSRSRRRCSCSPTRRTSGRRPVALAMAFAFWCIPQVFFYGLYTVLGQVLNARGRFGAYMWAPVLEQPGRHRRPASRSSRSGRRGDDQHRQRWTPGRIALLAGTATLGVVAQALVLIWPLRRAGFRYRPRLGACAASGCGTAGRVAGWTFAAVLVGQLGFSSPRRSTTAGGRGRGPTRPDRHRQRGLQLRLPAVHAAALAGGGLAGHRAVHADDRPAAENRPTVRDDLSLGLRSPGWLRCCRAVGGPARRPT